MISRFSPMYHAANMLQELIAGGTLTSNPASFLGLPVYASAVVILALAAALKAARLKFLPTQRIGGRVRLLAVLADDESGRSLALPPLTTHGLGRALFGSQTGYVLEFSTVPVVVVPAGHPICLRKKPTSERNSDWMIGIRVRVRA